jgi:hypothetical protein
LYVREVHKVRRVVEGCGVVGRIFAVALGGIIVWALLKWAEEAAGERNATFFRIAQKVLLVVVFFVEFVLLTVIPQVGQDVIKSKYEPTPYESVGGDSGSP